MGKHKQGNPLEVRVHLIDEPVRHEELTIKMEFDYAKLNASEKNLIQELTPHKLKKGDKVSPGYTLYCDYYGRAAKFCEVMTELYDKGKVLKGNLAELNHGKCLIRELLKRIELLEAKMNEVS